MANPEAGTKRVCPESGKKFYDLNKDPIVSPYTGESYPLSFFEAEKAESVKQAAKEKPADKAKEDDDDDDELEDSGAEIVSLEEADAEAAGDGSEIPSLDGDDDDEEITIEDDDNTFLETDDDDNDDVSDLIVDTEDGDKDT